MAADGQAGRKKKVKKKKKKPNTHSLHYFSLGLWCHAQASLFPHARRPQLKPRMCNLGVGQQGPAESKNRPQVDAYRKAGGRKECRRKGGWEVERGKKGERQQRKEGRKAGKQESREAGGRHGDEEGWPEIKEDSRSGRVRGLMQRERQRGESWSGRGPHTEKRT